MEALALPVRCREQITVFAVHHPADTLTEKVVWSIASGDDRPIVLTTHRLADLREIRYLNFLGSEKALPGIRTYYQRRAPEEESTTFTSSALLPAARPGRPQLPVEPYRGLLPEFIVYDRVLSPRERLQVESYLALKYGLTLSGEADYLNSQREVGWERRRQGAFAHRLAGIGRDDQAGLLQKQSTSRYEPGLLTIAAGRPGPSNAANRTELPDRSFMICADDGGAWQLEEAAFGQPRRVRRTWRITATGTFPPATLQVDLGRFALERANNQTYWLLVDRSGTGKFELGQVDYYPASSIAGRELASFYDIQWDADNSGSDCFTLGIGPAFSGLAWQEAPTCTPAAPGRLFIGAVGGQAPYRFRLDGPESMVHWQSDDGALRQFDQLPPGAYQLTVREAGGGLFRDSLFLQAADAPAISLAAEYTLPPDQLLQLDATTPGDVLTQYTWTGPTGRRHEGPDLSIDRPGLYQLRAEQQGCVAQHAVSVRAGPISIFREIALYPNPVKRGRSFQAAVHLTEASELEFSIFDVAGRRVRQRALPSEQYHFVGETLSDPGVYLIRLRGDTHTETRSLVVE